MFLPGKINKISLVLTLLTYGVFGWTCGVSHNDWLRGGFLVLLITLLLIAPIRFLQICFSSWLASDARAFISIIILSFLCVVVLTWLEVFAQFFVLLAAGILVRLDLQTAGFGEWQAFFSLAGMCLASFALGVFFNYLWLQTVWEELVF
jgi:hypothetical protein